MRPHRQREQGNQRRQVWPRFRNPQDVAEARRRVEARQVAETEDIREDEDIQPANDDTVGSAVHPQEHPDDVDLGDNSDDDDDDDSMDGMEIDHPDGNYLWNKSMMESVAWDVSNGFVFDHLAGEVASQWLPVDASATSSPSLAVDGSASPSLAVDVSAGATPSSSPSLAAAGELSSEMVADDASIAAEYFDTNDGQVHTFFRIISAGFDEKYGIRTIIKRNVVLGDTKPEDHDLVNKNPIEFDLNQILVTIAPRIKQSIDNGDDNSCFTGKYPFWRQVLNCIYNPFFF